MTTNSETRDLKYFLALSQIRKITSFKLQRLLAYFGNAQNIWQANLPDLVAAGIDESLAQEMIIKRSEISPDAELENMALNGVEAVSISDSCYPALLKQIYDPPAVIYWRGSLECLKHSCVAIVGTRKYSAYGQQAAAEIAGELSRQAVTVVSGMALGIDTVAHQAAVENRRPTAAVLGSGLDWNNIYPSANRYLAQKIIEAGGVILSEYPVGTLPAKYHFPARNRIIAGLSLGTLVIEAPESSGALITAKFALDYNREIFALPGSIYNLLSAGTNNLIKQGAKLVTNAADILEELNLQQITENKALPQQTDLTEEEKIVMSSLGGEPLHIDKLANLSKLKISVLLPLLMIMEFKGLIKNLGGKNYIINK